MYFARTKIFLGGVDKYRLKPVLGLHFRIKTVHHRLKAGYKHRQMPPAGSPGY
jgi:hypothetical protein